MISPVSTFQRPPDVARRRTAQVEMGTMESNRFDDLARTLADAAPAKTRRATVGIMLAGLAGGLLAGTDAAEARRRRAQAAAEKKGKGKGKGKGKKKPKKQCPSGQQECGGACVDTQTDLRNCGGCGVACSEAEICLNGGCFGCYDPLTRCGDICVDLTSDNANCGACGKTCGRNEECINKFCTCAGPRCAIGNGETKCCPAVGGVCCQGGGCCPNGQVCTQFGGCCPSGTFGCPDGVFCCPTGKVCGSGQCFAN